MSFPKCVLSVSAVHYRVKSITRKKRGVLINSFWLLDTINFSEFSEVKRRVVPLTQMQIRQTNVNAAINGFIWWCFVCVELQCIENSGSNSSLSTHYIIIDGSCLGLVHLFFSDLWQAAECWMEVYSAAVPAAPLTALSYFSIDHHTSQ